MKVEVLLSQIELSLRARLQEKLARITECKPIEPVCSMGCNKGS